jgi:alkylresorcinol/alkylpyrone synthase
MKRSMGDKNRSAKLLGIGTALPPHFIQQKDAAIAAVEYCPPGDKFARVLPALYELTRIQKRASVVLEKDCEDSEPTQHFFNKRENDPGNFGPDTESRMKLYVQKAPELALRACQEALAKSDTRPEEIGQLITVSCTGFSAPGFDIELIKTLPLTPSVGRVHIGFMGCHAMFNAFRTAGAFAQSHPEQKILICSVELCSLHYSYHGTYERLLSNALFADGAAASVFSGNHAGNHVWSLVENASCIFPDSEDAMRWDIGNHGFLMKLSDKVPALLARNLRPWLESWLKGLSFKLSDIRSWAIHPGGPRILDEIQTHLGLKDGVLQISYDVLSEYGNMSSATILFILNRLMQQKVPTPCVALSFGPGLTAEAALFT